MSEWKEVRLGELLQVKYGKDHKKLEEGNIPVYGSGGIMRYGDKCLYDQPSVLIPRKGTLSNIFFVEKPFWTVDTMFWTIIDSSKILPKYLYYAIKDYRWDTLNVGSAVPSLTVPVIEGVSIKLPSLSVQHRIASILSALDDKIAVNRRICENLESQAQALFKHWFIDFAPFKDGKFVESELGMIPEGWRVGKAEDFYTINIGKTPPRAERQWFSDSMKGNKIWISISDMGNCGAFISNSKEYLTPEAQSKFNVIMVPSGTVLLSFKLTIGRVAIADADLTTNEAIARFILPNIEYREFTYLYLKQYKYGSLGSTSSIATAVNSKIIKTMPFLMPSNDTISKFSIVASQIFDEIKKLNQESSRLSTLRDTLLPKLMSGQIKV